jgi:hypothetical protein
MLKQFSTRTLNSNIIKRQFTPLSKLHSFQYKSIHSQFRPQIQTNTNTTSLIKSTIQPTIQSVMPLIKPTLTPTIKSGMPLIKPTLKPVINTNQIAKYHSQSKYCSKSKLTLNEFILLIILGVPVFILLLPIFMCFVFPFMIMYAFGLNVLQGIYRCIFEEEKECGFAH